MASRRDASLPSTSPTVWCCYPFRQLNRDPLRISREGLVGVKQTHVVHVIPATQLIDVA